MMTSSTHGTRVAASAPDAEVRSVTRRSPCDSRTARRAGVVINTSPIASSRTQSTFRACFQVSLVAMSGPARIAQDMPVARPGPERSARSRSQARAPVVPLGMGLSNPGDQVGGGVVGHEVQDLDNPTEDLDQLRLGERCSGIVAP